MSGKSLNELMHGLSLGGDSNSKANSNKTPPTNQKKKVNQDPVQGQAPNHLKAQTANCSQKQHTTCNNNEQQLVKKAKRKGPNGKESLTPYQGVKRSYGYFKCPQCGKSWTSGNTWANMGQQCKQCIINVYPFKQLELKSQKGRSKADKKKAHPTGLCEKCRQVGKNCMSEPKWPKSTKRGKMLEKKKLVISLVDLSIMSEYLTKYSNAVNKN